MPLPLLPAAAAAAAAAVGTAAATSAASAGRVTPRAAAFGVPPATAAAVGWCRAAMLHRPGRPRRRPPAGNPASGGVGGGRRLLGIPTAAAAVTATARTGGDSDGSDGGDGGGGVCGGCSDVGPTSSGNDLRVPSSVVLATVTRVLTRRGTPPADAALMAEVLHYAQASGNSQGLAKLVSPGGGALGQANDPAAPPLPPPPPLVPVATSAISAHIDATGRSGMVAMAAAADEAIRLARATGTVGVVGTTGSTTGSGAIGYYARRVATAGLFGLAASGSDPLVAPSGTSVPLLGTNPLAYGIPLSTPADGDGGDDDGVGGGSVSGGDPPVAGTPLSPLPPQRCDALVADIGTSALSYWAVRAAVALDTPLPAHVAIDSAGTPTVTASAVAALLPFGGPAAAHKASALGVLVEWLTGPAVGAPAVGLPHGATAAGRAGHPPRGWGNIVVAVSPSLFRPAAEVAADTAGMVAALREAGCRLPGEGGNARRAAAAADGVRVDGQVWRALVDEAGGEEEGQERG
ncbi:hypothetical protein MMPV_005621 [Pyropia vietnamensis]